MSRALVAGASLLLLTATGCGSAAAESAATTAAPAPTVTTTATVTASPSPDAADNSLEPTSIKDVADQLEGLGLTCEEYEVSLKGVAAQCDDLILLGYSDGSTKQDNLLQASIALSWDSIRSQDREDEVALLVGDNWFARLALEDAKYLHDNGAGGVVLH